ncbi:LuxR C-terminal-related transcriptional regulator [Nocardia sp. R6R-6]|uniref:LuxR C-terminal-related transcriptional regulator n=1 Tax=Nocardia sp. R6R-6 TaxID=3459303 RepID=UPI00403DCB47
MALHETGRRAGIRVGGQRSREAQRSGETTRAPEVSSPQFATLVHRISELNARVSELATQATKGYADGPDTQLLGETLERVARRLAVVRAGSLDTNDLCELLTDVSAAQSTLRKHTLTQPGYTPARIFEAFARLRRKATAEEVLDAAPAELCATAGFDRAMISGIRGSIWAPRMIFLAEGHDSRVNRELSDYIADLEIPLSSPMVEAEVVRRRLPALVLDAQHEIRTFRPLMEASRTREYAVAPIVGEGAVLGLLHVDTYLSRRPLTTVDRDCLRTFAEGVGVIYERAVLERRLARQREHLAQVFREVEQIVDTAADQPVRLSGPVLPGAAAVAPDKCTAPEISARPEPVGLSQLTAREREVLALLAGGATNAQVADRLTLAESTVKSHVKHILHKLGAPNRASAIARYMRARKNEWRS